MKQPLLRTLLALLCIAALLLSCGCGKEKKDDTEPQEDALTAIDLNYFYMDYILQQSGDWYAFYLLQNQDGLDPTLPLDEQQHKDDSNKTWADYFVEQAINEAVRVYALCAAAEKDDFSLSRSEMDDALEAAKDHAEACGYDSFSEYLNEVYGRNASEKTYRAYLEKCVLAEAYYNHYSASLTFTSQQLEDFAAGKAEYAELSDQKTVSVRHILISFVSAEGNDYYTDADKAVTGNEMAQIVTEWESSAKTEDAFAELVKVYSEDTNASQGGLYTDIYPGWAVEPFDSWCFDPNRRPGDYGVVETDFGMHLIYFVSHGEQTYRELVLTEALRTEEIEKWSSSLSNAFRAEWTTPDTSHLNTGYVFDPQ